MDEVVRGPPGVEAGRAVPVGEWGRDPLYAKLIGFAAASTYGPPSEEVLLAVEAPVSSLQVDPRVKVVESFADGTHILSIPRWGPFSEIVSKLAERGVRFLEIAGNDDIALSLIQPRDASVQGLGQLLFDSRLVSDSSHVRRVVFVPVRELTSVLRALPQHAARLEHVYDY